MTWSGRPQGEGAAALDGLLEELEAEFPAFRILDKGQSRLCQTIDVVLRVLTLGGQRVFLTHYHTVLGDTLYVAPTWHAMGAVDRIILLRHERVHLRQSRRLTSVGMAFIYLVPWFPLGLAYGRARLEWEAYTETLRATAEWKGPNGLRSSALREQIVARFVGPDYGWMWPFEGQIRRWYDRAVEQIGQSHAS